MSPGPPKKRVPRSERRLQEALDRAQEQVERAQARSDRSIARAHEQVEQGVEEIRGFYRQSSRPEQGDQSGEVHSLETWLLEIRASRPLSAREKLERALSEAVQSEDYEKAAQVRDALRNLNAEK